MRKILTIALLLGLLSVPAFALTTTTDGDGTDWNTAANWDVRVPLAGDDAVMNHPMVIDGTGAVFATLDNNDALTFSATAIVEIDGGGSIDNAGGTINASGEDVTFKSSDTNHWTWTLNSGTWTDGAGIHTFEYGTLTVTAAFSGFNTGTYTFAENMKIIGSGASRDFTISTAFNITAGKTLDLDGDGNTLRFILGGVLTWAGTNGNEITINNLNDRSRVLVQETATLTMQYTNVVGGSTYNVRFIAVNGDNMTIENSSFSSSAGNGAYFGGACTNTITMSDCTFFTATNSGCRNDATGGAFIFNDCTSYSNSDHGWADANTAVSSVWNRCKAYGNSDDGIICGLDIQTISSTLAYENTVNGIRQLSAATTQVIINSTMADNTDDGYETNLASGKTGTVKNCIFADNGAYGVNDSGTDDPTVTYCDSTGNTTADYNGMTDPTGTNGNIDADPLFTNAAGDDYSILNTSPCQNTGTGVGAPANDINNDAWPNANPEMGCYSEAQVTPPGGNHVMVVTMM